MYCSSFTLYRDTYLKSLNSRETWIVLGFVPILTHPFVYNITSSPFPHSCLLCESPVCQPRSDVFSTGDCSVHIRGWSALFLRPPPQHRCMQTPGPTRPVDSPDRKDKPRLQYFTTSRPSPQKLVPSPSVIYMPANTCEQYAMIASALSSFPPSRVSLCTMYHIWFLYTCFEPAALNLSLKDFVTDADWA